MTNQEFIESIAPAARSDMATSGILASITIAQACLESAYRQAIDLCKTILGLDDCEFAKAIEVLKNSNDSIAETIYKILIEERRA